MEHIDRSGPGLDEIRERLEDEFVQRFGPGAGPRAFSAPGRVNLMGAHLDYNGGPVLPLAIDRRVWVLGRPVPGTRLCVHSLTQPSEVELELDELPTRPLGGWGDYAVGVARALRQRGARLGGMQLLVGGDLPSGAGLSSSAALCLALCLALEDAWDLSLGPRERVDVALEAERGFVGVSCGILDPFAISLAQEGAAIWLDTRRVLHEYVPLDLRAVRLALVDSGTRRRLSDGHYNTRVEECHRALTGLRSAGVEAECLADVTPTQLSEHGRELDPLARRRARHVVAEVERTRDARAALLCGDLARVGELLTATHDSLREHFEVSSPVLDELVARAVDVPGVYGGRVVGAGFGGCVAFLLDPRVTSAFEQAIRNVNRTPCEGASGLWYLASASGPMRH